MKKVYIIFTYTGTCLAKIIRQYTKKKYSHVSISLDENLQKMYSFGRRNPYIFFWGGFVHESMNYGTFKRFKKTTTTIYELEVTEEQYERLSELILQFKKNRKIYRFNILGLFGVAFKKKRVKENYYYCAEFLRYIFESSQVVTKRMPEVIKPEDFLEIPDLKMVYEGLLQGYQTLQNKKQRINRKIKRIAAH